MLKNRNLPVLSCDGLTMLRHARPYYPTPTKSVPEALSLFLKLIGENDLESFSSIDPWEPPTGWEWAYVSEGMGKHRRTYAEYERARNLTRGATRIRGNFKELSCVFDFYTKDPVIVEQFRAAFARNPSAGAMQAEEEKRQAYWAVKRPVYERWAAQLLEKENGEHSS